MNAARSRALNRLPIAIAVIVAVLAPRTAAAQGDIGRFLGGAAVALVAHEAGHVLFDAAFGAGVGVKKVSAGPLPFFAITHHPVTPAREFVISSAGFWVQHATDEIILTRDPDLRSRHAPFTKGMLAFNVLTSVMYAGAAFARIGPGERDTRGMAVSARVDEPWIGGLVLAPATFDAVRYYRPQLAWVRWASRASKVAGVVLIARAAM
jgi:hypothetical protein